MHTLRVLATDDEPGMRSAVVRALKGFRLQMEDIGEEVAFETLTAESGEQCLEELEKQPIDILLLDHKLPGISGLDVLDRLEGDDSGEMQTVMITAYASLDTAVSAIKKGAFDFLAKPFTPAELKEKVSKAATSIMLTRQARKLAAEKHQVRFEFISVLGHELKAPLAAVEGYLELLREQPKLAENEAQRSQILERCLIRMAQMRKMVFDLLEITRIESGRRQRFIEQIDLDETVRCCVETALPEADKRGIEIKLDSAPGTMFDADRTEIEILLNNLISNSVKYNVDNGSVTITITVRGSTATLAVSDTGIGMSEEECERLFGEFVRIKNEKTKDILGSGLGLSIMKKVASMYGGAIRVESSPGEGSTFTVTLNETRPDSDDVQG
jgi:two-component system, sensor histidine kinase and response regulator